MSEYNEANKLIERFYRRKYDELSYMQTAATTAGILFVSLMQEKKNITVHEQVVENLFGLALAAVPGAIFLTSTWKTLAMQRVVFSDNIQFAAGVAVDAIARTNATDWTNGNIATPKTTTGIASSMLSAINGRIHRGFEAIEKERTTAENVLLIADQANIKGYVGRYRKHYASSQMKNFRDQLDMISIAFEYMLLKEYTKTNVEVVQVKGEDEYPLLHSRTEGMYQTSGLNDTQLNYIYGKFGTDLTKSNLNSIYQTFNTIVEKSQLSLSYSELTANFKRALSSQIYLRPINNPKNLVDVWGARFKRGLLSP